MRFSMFAPWGDYRVLYTDYTSVVVVYSCSRLLMGMYSLDYVWVLTREILPLNSAAHSEMLDRVTKIIEEKVPNYDMTQLRYTK